MDSGSFEVCKTWETSKVGGLPPGRSREQDGRAIGGQCGSRRGGCELQEGHKRQKRGKEGQEEGPASTWERSWDEKNGYHSI